MLFQATIRCDSYCSILFYAAESPSHCAPHSAGGIAPGSHSTDPSDFCSCHWHCELVGAPASFNDAINIDSAEAELERRDGVRADITFSLASELWALWRTHTISRVIGYHSKLRCSQSVGAIDAFENYVLYLNDESKQIQTPPLLLLICKVGY